VSLASVSLLDHLVGTGEQYGARVPASALERRSRHSKRVLRNRPDVPVIMITAYGDDVTKRKALQGGAEGLLTKPLDFVALRSEIDSRVGRAG
jgi:CheY-like chemotaxis protein